MYAALDVLSTELWRIVSALKPESAADVLLIDWKTISDASKFAIESLIRAWKRRVVDTGYLVLS
ncbi:MAG: hypothetical protein ACREPD_15540 [Stenotrophomonas sp.]|uniref:hypothetical protein n=1 Tax=Stenotrophomonas sp. TaxID=69392 RepID=UPI003D6CD0B4